MDHDPLQNREWPRIARALFRSPDVQVSEAFVHRLMARIEALERPRCAAPWSAAIRWLVPAAGLAGLLLVVGPVERAISVEALLLAEEQENAPAQYVLASEPPTTDEALGSIVEAQP